MNDRHDQDKWFNGGESKNANCTEAAAKNRFSLFSISLPKSGAPLLASWRFAANLVTSPGLLTVPMDMNPGSLRLPVAVRVPRLRAGRSNGRRCSAHHIGVRVCRQAYANLIPLLGCSQQLVWRNGPGVFAGVLSKIEGGRK
jgi:hypothetical protein